MEVMSMYVYLVVPEIFVLFRSVRTCVYVNVL